MKAKNLSGVYMPIKNKGFDTISFEELPEEEQYSILDSANPDFVKALCIILARTINDVADKYDIQPTEYTKTPMIGSTKYW